MVGRSLCARVCRVASASPVFDARHQPRRPHPPQIIQFTAIFMSIPSTPRHRDVVVPSTPANRLNASAIHASPHYSTTRRHSLYGTEDRIILDPGSRVWKAGFSGEGRPRDVFFVSGSEQSTLWTQSRAVGGPEGEEKERMLRIQLQSRLRNVFHQYVIIPGLLR